MQHISVCVGYRDPLAACVLALGMDTPTETVARRLGVTRSAVGYAKRRAISRQYISRPYDAHEHIVVDVVRAKYSGLRRAFTYACISDTWRFWPLHSLAAYLGFSDKTVWECLLDLQLTGLIERRLREGSNGYEYRRVQV